MVIEIHLAIEDLLTDAIRNALLHGLSVRTPLRREVDELLENARAIRFGQKLNLARALRLITPKQQADLEKLNSVRNACGHRWEIARLTRRGTRRAAPKKAVLRYNGKNINQTEAFIDFYRHFSRLYVRLWLRLSA
jgi:hypothetical protein